MPDSRDHRKAPHVALLPSAGMGHLVPSTRLAAALVERGCEVSFIAVRPTVSAAEARHLTDFFAAFPQIHTLEFHVPPLDGVSGDPFFVQFEAIRCSAHLLAPLLSGSPLPLSALVTDISLASTCLPVAAGIGLPSYLLFTASAAMLSLCAYYPTLNARGSHGITEQIEIPGLPAMPKASLPSPLRDPAHLFTTQFVENSRALCQADGILINTFQSLEPESLAALSSGAVLPGLPPVIAVGPLRELHMNQSSSPLPWLDAQPARSVVYVSFGSRTAMSVEQIKELGAGLERSGHRFLWVIKSKKVDREEDVGIEELLGVGFPERVKDRGMVVKEWVEQEEVLKHRAVGGFVSHCGWNSVTEAALHGVRVLAWPRIGDQRVNAGVVKRSGLGVWVEGWSWEADAEVVKAEEIAARVKEMMEDRSLCASTEKVAHAAAKAIGDGGSSDKAFTQFIAKLKE